MSPFRPSLVPDSTVAAVAIAAPNPAPDTRNGWMRASLDGWRLWLAGGLSWRAVVVAALALHLSYLPLPPHRSSLWVRSAWDTQWFGDGGVGSDFFGIYEAGVRARHGRDPYSVNTDKTTEGTPDFASFRYIPLTAYVLAIPLSLPPPWIAYWLWLASNELILVFNLGLTASLAPPSRRRALGLIWLAWFPLHIEWHMGQFSFLMGSLMFWTGVGLWSGRERAGVLFWGLSTWMKNWTALFWLWWIGRGGRAGWMATLWLVVAGLTTAGYFAARPGAYESFSAAATQGRLAGGASDLYWGRQGTQMAASVLFSGGRFPPPREANAPLPPATWTDPARWLNAALSLAALAIVAVACLRRKNAVHSLDVFALVWLWWFIAYLDTWEHHYVMLLPLAALLGATGRLSGWTLWVPAALWGMPSLWSVAGPSVAAGEAGAPGLVMLYFLQRPIGVFWVFAAIARRVLRRGAGEAMD